MRLNFLGADHEVTGSCHFLQACGVNILVDCGMEQGADITVGTLSKSVGSEGGFVCGDGVLIDYLKNDFDFIIVDSPAGIEQGFTYASSIADEAIIVVNLDLATLRDNDRVIGLLLKKGIQDLKLIINKVNLDDIEDGKSLTIDDALDILSLPLLGIVYEDHEMIEANNKGRPVYLLKGHLLHDCFDNIAHRLLGHKRAFAKCKRRGLLSRIFLG